MDKAVAYLKKAIAQDPDSVVLTRELVQLLLAAKKITVLPKTSLMI